MIKPHDFSKRLEARERIDSYRSLPSEERAEKLREEVHKAEESIFVVTGDPLECSYWEPLRDEADAEMVEDLLDLRYHALSELFEMHCSDAEVAALERQNARMLEYTEQMFERTGKMFRYMLDMPREDRGEEIEVEGSLNYWEDGDVLQTPDDSFYGSDFKRMIPIISEFDSECKGDLPIIGCLPRCRDFDSSEPSTDDKTLGLENFLDDGQSWAEGVLRNPKLDRIVFCYATHVLVTDKGYSIPDFIRLDLFEVRVEVKSQDFRQEEQDKSGGGCQLRGVSGSGGDAETEKAAPEDGL